MYSFLRQTWCFSDVSLETQARIDSQLLATSGPDVGVSIVDCFIHRATTACRHCTGVSRNFFSVLTLYYLIFIEGMK